MNGIKSYFADSKLSLFLLILLGIILFPIIFFGNCPDNAIYLEAGRTILEGKKIYVDFIDLKPPLFYTFYALLDILSFNSVILFNVISFVIFYLTSLILFFFVKQKINLQTGFVASIIYAISIVVLNINTTGQAETLFSIFPLLTIIVYIKSIEQSTISIFSKNSIPLIFYAVLLAVLFSLKYTFGLILVGFILYDILSGKFSKSELLLRNFYVVIIFIISTVLLHFLLFDKEILEAYLLNFTFVKYYANVPALNMDLVKEIIKQTGIFFGDNFSLFFSISFLFGLVVYLTKQSKEKNILVEVSFLMFIMFFFSVVIERKMFTYHFGRLFIPLSILTAKGVSDFIHLLKNKWQDKSFNLFNKLTVVSLLLFFLIFSPVPRYLNILKTPVYYLKGQEAYLKYLDNSRPETNLNYPQYLVANYINKNYPAKINVLLIATSEFDLTYLLKENVIKLFPQRAYYLSAFSIPQYKTKFLKLLDSSDVLIIGKSDYSYHLTGNQDNSWQAIQKDTVYSKIINKNFKEVYSIKEYIVLQKMKNTF
jgi:4-amino-4-deoxy-L-arabinose transferase-like glycosyltransferase